MHYENALVLNEDVLQQGAFSNVSEITYDGKKAIKKCYFNTKDDNKDICYKECCLDYDLTVYKFREIVYMMNLSKEGFLPKVYDYKEQVYSELSSSEKLKNPTPKTVYRGVKEDDFIIHTLTMERLDMYPLNKIYNMLDAKQAEIVIRNFYKVLIQLGERHIVPYDNYNCMNIMIEPKSLEVRFIDPAFWMYYKVVKKIQLKNSSIELSISQEDRDIMNKDFKKMQLDLSIVKDRKLIETILLQLNNKPYVMVPRSNYNWIYWLKLRFGNEFYTIASNALKGVVSEYGFSLYMDALRNEDMMNLTDRAIRNWLSYPSIDTVPNHELIRMYLCEKSKYLEMIAKFKDFRYEEYSKNKFYEYLMQSNSAKHELNKVEKKFLILNWLDYMYCGVTNAEFNINTEVCALLGYIQKEGRLERDLFRMEFGKKEYYEKIVVGNVLNWKNIISCTKWLDYALSYKGNSRGSADKESSVEVNVLFRIKSAKAALLRKRFCDFTTYDKYYNPFDAENKNFLTFRNIEKIYVSNEYLIEPSKFKVISISKENDLINIDIEQMSN